MTPFSIAGIQMLVSAGGENVTAMGQRLDLLMLRFPWVQMVVFSELCAFGPAPKHAQAMPGPAEIAFCQMAARHGLWLIPGSMFERRVDGIYNTTPVIDPQGNVVTRYRKMFPFMPYEAGILPGREFCVFDVPHVGRFGVSICYDMWFPETTRQLASLGAEVILHPTLTDTIDRDVELPIARASATVNQCYFFDVNGVGDGGTGRSIIIDPAGGVLYEAGRGPEMVPIEIDLEHVRRQRERGVRGLGQTLKSFRDRPVDFPVYSRSDATHDFLASLGPVVKPARQSSSALASAAAATTAPLQATVGATAAQPASPGAVDTSSQATVPAVPSTQAAAQPPPVPS
ncbi:MAG TPA: carbon-nitrogen hydrolase family protein [Casimicrobiaceae bacterium]|nr:carbon-nitrogen hydrolase family protein [Casimicrobiaceae bacterium]